MQKPTIQELTTKTLISPAAGSSTLTRTISTAVQCHNACLQEGFAGSDENETSTFHVRAFSDDSDKEYVLEVDLEYPRGLHGQHNAYPLDPERLRVCREWMSQYQIDLGEDLGRSSVDVDN